jgi:hypothetical protein
MHSDNRNYAAASDILRYRLIDEYGGIYLDCDDTIDVSFAGAPLKAGPNDVLLGRRLEESRKSRQALRTVGNGYCLHRLGSFARRAVC